jgi:hypothetical protein
MLSQRHLRIARVGAIATIATIALVLSGCQSDSNTYDIAPIFPLSADKCAKYDGTPEGTGLTAHCWVTKAKCEQAAQDWRDAMHNVDDAIQFTC